MKYQILLVSAIIDYATKFDKSRAPESQLSNAEVSFKLLSEQSYSESFGVCETQMSQPDRCV